MKNILVAIDDCETTTIHSSMIERAIELANAFSGKVWVLHVVPPSGQAPFTVDSKVLRREVASELRHEHEFLHRLAQCLRGRGIDATALLVEGAIVESILNESERLEIDLIIVGCYRHGMLYGALMEFTEQGLISKCPRPIMFTPA